MTKTVSHLETIEGTGRVRSFAAQACFIQCGCNPVPIAKLLAEWQTYATHHLRGTAVACKHPITIVLLDKLASLSGVQHIGHPRIMEAHAACSDLEEGKDVGWPFMDCH